MFNIFGIYGNNIDEKETLINDIFINQNSFPNNYTFLKSNFFLFYIIYNKVSPDIYKNDSLNVIVYGNCYTLLNDTSGVKNNLNAKDIYNLFNKKGKLFINTLKGNFIIFLLKIDKLLIFTSQLNTYNLFYQYFNNKFIVSTSLNILVEYNKVKKCNININNTSILEYFAFDHIISNNTFIKGVYSLPPGYILELRNNKLSKSKYFNSLEYFSFEKTEKNKLKYHENITINIFRKNIELFKLSPEDMIFPITGGYDSRSIISQLTNEEIQEYIFFSYGLDNKSYDYIIPHTIKSKLNLNYKFIPLGSNFRKYFSKYATLLLQQSDGETEINKSNIVYVYSNYFQNKSHIMSGLFGSELIKLPTSRGLFLNNNIINLLKSNNIELAIDDLYKTIYETKIFDINILERCYLEFKERIISNIYINNKLKYPYKLFSYLMAIGTRKYFSKEINLEKPFITNITPFYDIEFIKSLLKTNFPWARNWSEKKNIFNSINTHKIYAYLIKSNPLLLNIISTHGYKPKYLLSKTGVISIPLSYLFYKQKIDKYNLNYDELILPFIQERQDIYKIKDLGINSGSLTLLKYNNIKDYIKLHSFIFWYYLNIKNSY